MKAYLQQDSTIIFKWENSKMFDMILKYFSIFNNKALTT